MTNMNDKENEIFLFVTFYVFYAMSQLAWMVARKPGVGRFYEILYKCKKSHQHVGLEEHKLNWMTPPVSLQ